MPPAALRGRESQRARVEGGARARHGQTATTAQDRDRPG